jgi:hypothetical protein
MTEKTKRKNAPPTPKAYWWIFGTLALVLLIGLWYPIHLTASYDVNAVLYALIGLACLLTLIRFVRLYRWKRPIVIVIVLCVLFAVLVPYVSVIETNEYCRVHSDGIFTVYDCSPGGWMMSKHIGLANFPIVIRTGYWCCCWCPIF